MDEKDFGIGAQILHDLNITNLHLITNTKKTKSWYDRIRSNNFKIY